MKIFTTADLDDFLLNGVTFEVVSSNVAMASYEAETFTLFITYDGGECWAYDPISPSAAASFIQATSHGGWLWSNVRVRGTKHEHQCRASQIH